MKRLKQRLIAGTMLAIMVPFPAMASSPASDPAAPLVPLRLVAESAQARVDWDGAAQSVTITTADGGVAVVLIGRIEATVDGQTVTLARAPELVNDRTMVSPDFLTRVLGMPFAYDPEAGEVRWDPLMLTARAMVRALPTPEIAEFRDRFSPALQAAIPVETLSAISASMEVLGELGRVTVLSQSQTAVHHNVELYAPFAELPMQVTVRFTPDGQIDDFTLVPFTLSVTAGSPAYADPAAFTEEEVVVGEAPWRLPGTLSLPVGEGPFPAVVLVHGSGPNDRDETVTAVKPFRDLAHGLASHGVAVLRYEKRTLEHSQKFSASYPYTLQEESVEDALLAVKLLAADPRIDPERIYVLGHSLGGVALPRILSQDVDRQIRGGIMMAAPNSMLDIMVEQLEIMAQQGDAPPAQAQMMAAQVAMLKDPAFDPANPPEGYWLGTPEYWLDLRPLTSDLLRDDDRPLLFLQGARDYQVPASQLESFKQELAGRTNLTYKLYPKLNHVFTEGEGEISRPAEYNHPANIPFYVIEDILEWIGE